MPIIYNGVTLTDIKYNGVSLDKVIYNGVTVFEKGSPSIPSGTREPTSGEYFSSPGFAWIYMYMLGDNLLYFNSANTNSPIGHCTGIQTSWSDGTWTYYKGSMTGGGGVAPQIFRSYAIYRIKN